MISAVIFDLDGTVIDSEIIWEDIFRRLAHENNISFEKHIPGIGVLNNWKKLVPDGELAEKLTAQTKQVYIDQAMQNEVAVRPGAVELVEKIKEMGWQTALATGTEWNVVEKELEQLDLFLAFDVTTTGDEVLAKKPDPEIYTLTVQKLGLEPSNCVVVEDSVSGVEAAVEAGCLVIGLENELTDATALRAAGAKLIVDNFAEILNQLSGEVTINE